MVLTIEEKTKRYKVYSFFLSLLFHLFLFVFSLKALVALQGNLSKGKEVEVNLVNIEKPKVVIPVPVNPPVVKSLVRNIQASKTVVPIKQKVVIPDVKSMPKMVDVPNVKEIKIAKPLNKRVLNIDENALDKVLVSAHPERYLGSVPSKVDVKLNRAVKPINVAAPVLPNIGERRVKNAIPKSLYDSLLARYTALVREVIEKHKFYPEIAREEGVEGKVLLEFKILKNGKLAFVKVLKSSSYDILDSAAVYSVKKAAPLPPIPKKLGKRAITLRLWVKFELGG